MATIIMSQVVGATPFFPCGPCMTCFQIYGDTMEATVTGVALCGCFSDTSIGPGTRYWNGSNMVGVNGIFTLNADSPGDPANTIWSATIGTIDLQEYQPDLCVTPIGVPTTVDVVMTVNCFVGQGLQASINVPTGVIGGTAALIFTSIPPTYFAPGDVVNNNVICTADGLGYFQTVAAGGSSTITPP